MMLDHVVALTSTAAWFIAGTAAALHRARTALWLLVTAVLLVVVRGVTVGVLATQGWWFVQEKILLGFPFIVVTASAAVLISGRPMLRSREAPDDVLPTSSIVAIFAAGLAALVGLVLTLLIGYPLTWDTALIALAAWGASVVLTGRLVATSAASLENQSHPGTRPSLHVGQGMSRRRFINVAGTVAVVTTAGTGTGLAVRARPRVSTGGGPGPALVNAVSVTDLRGASFPAPGGRRLRHLLTAQETVSRLPSGKKLDTWTFNGQAPGPAIVATQGDLLEVTLRNTDIDDGVTLHWHGYDVACGEDGAPGATQLAVLPGQEFAYRFRADQVGTYWYHTHQASHIGVRKGLYGTLVVHPRDAQTGTTDLGGSLDLTLPIHTFDDTVVIGDHAGPVERTAAAGRPVRMRLINTDSNPHWIALVGATFRVAALDGRDLNGPHELHEVGLRLPAGGRYDLTFEMPATPVSVVLNNRPQDRVAVTPDGDNSAHAELPDTSTWPELDLMRYGQRIAVPLAVEKANRRFTIVLDRGVAMVNGRPTFAQTVNGLGHPKIPDQLVVKGDIVRLTVVNRSLETHPWHLHGHPVLVLARNGTWSSGSPLWMDTFDVRPGEVWEVAFEASNPGVWMNHCHNLPHAEQGMMLRLVYDGITPLDAGHASHAH